MLDASDKRFVIDDPGTTDWASSPNARLIEIEGGRQRLDTPALVVELQAMERNIARMADFTAACSIMLRPHVKTHMSIEVAKRQVAVGAIGVSCVTLGETKYMVDGGIPGALMTSPVVTTTKIERLIGLARRAGPGSAMIVVDHSRNVAELTLAASDLDHPLDVPVEYAASYNRTGATTKCFATDSVLPVVARGADPDGRYALVGDEHGKLYFNTPKGALR